MAKSPIRIGIWGLGRAGWGMHTEEIDRYKDEAKVVAGCDVLPERTAKLKERYPEIQEVNWAE